MLSIRSNTNIILKMVITSIRYSKAKTVQSIMRHIASTHRMSLEEVCSKIAWPLYDTFGHAYDGLSKLVG